MQLTEKQALHLSNIFNTININRIKTECEMTDIERRINCITTIKYKIVDDKRLNEIEDELCKLINQLEILETRIIIIYKNIGKLRIELLAYRAEYLKDKYSLKVK